jgi:hypothetical protein
MVYTGVGDSPHIMIIIFVRVNHFIYTMYNIYTIYTHSLTDSLLLTERLLLALSGSASAFLLYVPDRPTENHSGHFIVASSVA